MPRPIAVLAAEEARLRALLGDYVFGADEQTMELVVVDLLQRARPQRSRSPNR